MKIALLCLAATACAHGPEPVATPPPAPAVDLVAVSGGLADQMCACHDATCAAGVRQQAAESAQAHADDKLRYADVPKVTAATERLDRCEKKAKRPDPVVLMDKYADKMCACQDEACVQQVQSELAEAASQFSGDESRPSDDEMKKIMGSMTKMSNCVQDLMAAKAAQEKPKGPPPAPVKVGVKACDDYVTKYLRCIDDKLPEAGRDTAREAVAQMADAWKQAASTPEGKKVLGSACKQALDSAKQATQSLGCKW